MSTVLKKGAPSRSYPSQQRKLGPAPFASFEDLSDELESPADGQQTSEAKVDIMPEIKEDNAQPEPEPEKSHKPVTATSSVSTGTFGVTQSAPTSGPTSGLQTPSTPRIDISCASSSTPPSDDSGSEKELFQGGLGFAFHEEGTEELRSSTEELDLGDVDIDSEEERKKKKLEKEKEEIYRRSSHPANLFFRRKSSNVLECDDDDSPHRKPSAHTLFLEGLLSRPATRHASFGSTDYANRPGAVSSMSAYSTGSMRRSPSPHKMMLETSFCGSKPIPTKSMEMDSPPKDTSTPKLDIASKLELEKIKPFNKNANLNLSSSFKLPSNLSAKESCAKLNLTAPSSPKTPPKSPRSPRDFDSRRPSAGRRSASPFKMIYETSFCGNKPIPTKSMEQESPPKDLPDLNLGSFLSSNAKTTLTTVQVHMHSSPSPTSQVKEWRPSPDSPRSSDHWRPISPRSEKGPSPPPQGPGTMTPHSPETASNTDHVKTEQNHDKVSKQTPTSPQNPTQAQGKFSPDVDTNVISSGAAAAADVNGHGVKCEQPDEITNELKISEDPVVTVEDAMPLESKGLFQATDSFDEDEDLPYVPTTLPQEKSSVPLIFPSKERNSSVTTTPVQRPKVVRPPNPASINDYIKYSYEMLPKSVCEESEKMKINLPREDSQQSQGGGGGGAAAAGGGGATSDGSGASKLTRKKSGSVSTTTWSDFAEMGLRSPRDIRRRLKQGNGAAEDVSSCRSDSTEPHANASDDDADPLLKPSKLPFGMDLDVRSNRSSIHSQEEAQHSPGSPSSVSSLPFESSEDSNNVPQD